MNVTLCQTDIEWEDKPTNFGKISRLLRSQPPPEGGLLVLPEMFATGFSMNAASIAEQEGGETQQFLAGLAREYKTFVLGGLVTAGADGKGRNEAVMLAPDGTEAARYCKMHPFTYAGEANHYSPGDCPVVVPCGDAMVAPFICYDLRFPEVFRDAVQKKAEVLVVIANWPDRRAAHWTALLQARAIENQSYVVGVNRCGQDPSLRYEGGSAVIDPRGNVLAHLGSTPKMISAELSISDLKQYRHDFPFLADMRANYFPHT